MLIAGRKLTAHEARQAGLVSAVYEVMRAFLELVFLPSLTWGCGYGQHDLFEASVRKRVGELARLPRNSLFTAKATVREHTREVLHKVNASECKVIERMWQSEECAQAVAQFLGRK